MKFKLEYTFDIHDGVLLIDVNDGLEPAEEYTSLDKIPTSILESTAYIYLDSVIEHMTYDEVTIKKL